MEVTEERMDRMKEIHSLRALSERTRQWRKARAEDVTEMIEQERVYLFPDGGSTDQDYKLSDILLFIICNAGNINRVKWNKIDCIGPTNIIMFLSLLFKDFIK